MLPRLDVIWEAVDRGRLTIDDTRLAAVEIEPADMRLLGNGNSKSSASVSGISRWRCLIICTYVLVAVGFLIGIYVLRVVPQFNQYRLVRTYPAVSRDADVTGPRTILLWNKFFGAKRWSLPDDTIGPETFRQDLRCEVYQCELTNQRDLLPSVDMYDAVVFHTAEMFPLINSIPAKRSPKQQYVFALMEPPGETHHMLGDEGNFYNLTMTYHLDSDIVWPYQTIEDVRTGKMIAPAKFPAWLDPPDEFNDTAVSSAWKGKTKMSAWFVSHYPTLSERERLATELQKFIGVDIYGKFGNLSCEYKSKECDNLLDRDYYFYLSFENALCTDYVTEKVYNALKRNVIPVVFGGADYSRFLPPRSYINVEDFADVKALAQYLKFVVANPAEYGRYFWWRRHYRLATRSPFCDLCEKLHSIRHFERSQSYGDIESWWMAGRCRFKAKTQF